MNIRFSATTHVGRVRKINEDSVLALPEQNIWVVSDGMGGHSAGDFASRTVIDMVMMTSQTDDPAEKMRGLRDAIQHAHAIIRDEAAERGGTVGATVVTLLLTEGHFVTFWAGDSRLYRFREGRIELLTTDHSLVADLVVSGKMSWDEAELHPNSNAITRAVGVGDELELDKVRGDVRPGDRFLLCSDGLNKYATMVALERMVPDAPIETVADMLVNVALDGGGADNISVIVVDVN